MNIEQQKLLQVLFDDGQASCFTPSPHGYKISHGPRSDDEFFAINALHPYEDLVPQKEWHSQYQPRRADGNVVCFRNFLIELDDMPLQEQAAYVMDKIPVTSVVYSGGKSLHFVISLAEPLPDAASYREVATRLLALFPKADKTCKNPSRLSRLPGVRRLDTGKMQELRYIGRRVPNSELLSLLPDLPKPTRIYSKSEQRSYVSTILIEACTTPDQFMQRMGMHGRNLFFFYLGKRMDDCDMVPEKRAYYATMAYENLQNVKDFSLEEALAAARVREN